MSIKANFVANAEKSCSGRTKENEEINSSIINNFIITQVVNYVK